MNSSRDSVTVETAAAYLNAWWDVVDDAYGFTVRMSGQRVRDDVILHLSCRLVARLHAVDGFTGGTLQTEETCVSELCAE